MVAMRSIGLLISITTCVVYGDIYLHSPRGSNNRLDGNRRERNNGNRMFDSQNNNRGGYNVGSLYYYAGSILPIEWTNQHSCGGDNSDCQIIIQYMCDDKLRDGTTEKTIPDHNNQCENNDCNTDMRFGMNENYDWYNECRYRNRNIGLFTADQKLNHQTSARYTRQNPKGERRGYECPEERDYYPYWQPTPWKDIAILTNDVSRCSEIQSESQNVKEKYSCVPPVGYMEALANKDISQLPRHLHKNLPLNKEECEKIKFPVPSCPEHFGNWTKTEPWGLPAPECIAAPRSRDNHNGNGAGGFPNMYNWTVPNLPHGNCALRIRYNISASDIPMQADSSLNGNDLNWPNDYSWTSRRPDWRRWDCIQIVEKKDPRTWQDNYFCWNREKRNPGMKWSSEGPIDGMRCTQITEPEDNDGWENNYLCVQNSSSLHFKWSSYGPVPNADCIKWYEASDRDGWSNNYLCSEKKAAFKIVAGPMEKGYCVKSDNRGQSSGLIKVNSLNINTDKLREDCLKLCLQHSSATGCVTVRDQRNKGCYIHTKEVVRGNGVDRHYCWVFTNLNNLVGTKVDIASTVGLSHSDAALRGYILKEDPIIKPLNVSGTVQELYLKLAINTAQYGRTFQDRSHSFEIRARPPTLPSDAVVHNINVRGKRGNIVQTYPAVEYDFIPNRVDATVDDYVHFQWTGSNTNPNNNAGQGRQGSDRSNVVLLAGKIYPEGTPEKAGSSKSKHGQWGRSYPQHLEKVSFLGLSKNDLTNLALLGPGQFGGEMSELDDAGTYFDLPPKQISKNGTHYYMCTRNNNFTNRSQKGKIIVKSKDT